MIFSAFLVTKATMLGSKKQSGMISSRATNPVGHHYKIWLIVNDNIFSGKPVTFWTNCWFLLRRSFRIIDFLVETWRGLGPYYFIRTWLSRRIPILAFYGQYVFNPYSLGEKFSSSWPGFSHFQLLFWIFSFAFCFWIEILYWLLFYLLLYKWHKIQTFQNFHVWTLSNFVERLGKWTCKVVINCFLKNKKI